MKLEDLGKRYLCYSCNEYFTGDNICPLCGEIGDHKGYEMNFAMSEAKLNNQQQRKEHRTKLLQPYREGQISKEYLDAYPKQKAAMIKNGHITKEQAKKAKEVWSDKADIL